ncbi:MAG: PEP/pyruvate-binding domain-containing protein [Candidatus Bipolaricaulota bacterium]|nr:PEP/pyruvate-binding domain-containing protein [Candidatus Bipolaricaulota bacterium]
MDKIRESGLFPSGRLRERVKELCCLQGIVTLLETPGLTQEDVFHGVLDLIPNGWQYPELCRVRIKCRDRVFQTPGFIETDWIQRVPLRVRGVLAGSLEVAYSEKPQGSREDPFLLEEKKLIELIGSRIGRLIKEWEDAATPDSLSAAAEPAAKHKPEWIVILDLLKETDPVLYKRVLRRLMNHLNWQGVPGVQGLLLQFSSEFHVGKHDSVRDENQPLPRQNVEVLERVFEEAIWIASLAVPDKELASLIKQWMRQDRFGFFILATEKRDISLVEIKEIINRFCRSAEEDEQALSRSDELQARIALVRRFLSERLPFIRIAREHMTIHDFGQLLARVTGPSQGTGKLGGKAAGMVLAEHILRKKKKDNPGIGEFRTPETWFIASDGLIDFIHYNFLEDFQSFKFSRIEEIRHNYPYLEQVCKHSFFSPEMQGQLKIILEDMGEGPLIVRSSSLLEDSKGTAFSGKYRSLFLANLGTKEERLTALAEAVAEVYASIFNPDAIQYRAERGLLDYYEEMGVLIQRVVGRRVGRYFFPAFAGVAFGNNEFRWSPRIRREDGVLRLVAGLGTRAVDRVGNDYPMLVSPGQPGIRVNIMPEEIVHYSQKLIDVINMETGRLETHPIDAVIREVGAEFPLWDKVLSVFDGTTVRKANRALDPPDREGMAVTFAGLIENTDFIKQTKEIMRVLRETFGMPMDVEFASDGKDLYILQCRPQSYIEDEERVQVPKWVPEKRKLFTAGRYVTNAQVMGIRTIVYVDPENYSAVPSFADLVAVGDAVSRLNAMLPRRSFILMGPGRWGSRGDIRLGVRVTYSDINNSSMLIEIAHKVGNYVPDLSFGTHFFQDLVEANIRYLALYPDEEGVVFSHEFFKNSPNSLADLLPEYQHLSNVINVINVPAVAQGCEANVIMDAESEMALGYLAEPKK